MHSPSCAKLEMVRLMWLSKSGEPPGDPNHNIAYDHDIIDICPDCHGATLEKLRHDCFDFEEVWDQHEWYDFSAEDGARLRAIAARCEQALNPFCNCATHQLLRQSANTLPTSSWDAVFEASAHRHLTTVSDGPKPAFTVLGRGLQFTPVQHTDVVVQGKVVDKEALLFVGVAWPITYATVLMVWFWLVDLPFYVDALYVLVMLPVTFVVSGVLMALPAAFKR